MDNSSVWCLSRSLDLHWILLCVSLLCTSVGAIRSSSSLSHDVSASRNEHQFQQVKSLKPSTAGRPCPCADVLNCKRITSRPEREVFVFSVSPRNWQSYDWTKATTVVQFGYHDDEMMCFAHAHGVRVVSVANIASSNLTDPAARQVWVSEKIALVKENFLDGLNVDFESEIAQNQTDLRQGFLLLIQELTKAAKALGPEVQVTIDYAWSPDCVDQRCYAYKAMAAVVDFVFVMSYDERSQIHGDCVAWANSAFNNTNFGLTEYLKILPPSKIVLGLPWYGYHYPCTSYNMTSGLCSIARVPFRGVSCSDAAGREVDYHNVLSKYLPLSFTGRLWDDKARSPFLTYRDTSSISREESTVYQVWYDDPESLRAKYQLSRAYGLRGVGMWNADSLDYGNKDQVRQMWSTLQ